MMLKNFIRQAGGPTELFQRILGHVAATAAIVGVTARYSPGLDDTALPQNLQPVDISFVPSCMSAPGAGIQAYCVTQRMPRPLAWESCTTCTQCQGYGRGPQLCCNTNCLELLAVLLALSRLRGRLPGKDVLIRTENNTTNTTATFAYFNRQCGYAPVACCNSPRHHHHTTLFPGVRSIWGVASCHPHLRSVQSGGHRPVSSSTSWGVENSFPKLSSWLE